MNPDRSLHHLARACGIQTAFRDVRGRPQTASDETLLALLPELGVPVASPKDCIEALRTARRQIWRRMLQPVSVAWDGRLLLEVRRPQRTDASGFRIHLEAAADLHVGEPLEALSFAGSLADLTTVRTAELEGVAFIRSEWRCPQTLTSGYYRLTLEIGDQSEESLVIAAPSQMWSSESDARRMWGVFVPLYALHSEANWGGGDFSDLERLMEWVNEQGGDLVATLPLLASQHELTNDPSPYSPSSRLFWNEFYLDVRKVPELSRCADARALLESSSLEDELQELRNPRWVKYARQGALQRRVLELLTESAFSGGEPAELRRFIDADPDLADYARHRAVCERLQKLWPQWPEPLRSGEIRPEDYDEQAFRYHLFVQWQAHEQVAALAEHAAATDMVWYLDFPLGVSSHGYDVWRNQSLFAANASGGAPPDDFFTKGQDWGFPPLVPQALREDGYRYFIRTLRHHLRYAKLLRIDHVMGLYRLYWVPRGMPASQGAYVRYPMDELYAVLSLESHLHQATIVGENLGTVPDIVNTTMNRHGVGEMYVVQYETPQGRKPLMRPVSARSVASLNTHDMPSFLAFWTGLDVDERVDLGLMDEAEASAERDKRAKLREELVAELIADGLLSEATRDPLDVQRALLERLGCSDADVVFATLEDLWLESEPQNTPGTFQERRNWQRKLRFSIDEFQNLPQVHSVLAALRESRNMETKSA